MTETTNMNPVPPEIIDQIFSFLQSDPNTLAICSRAHPNLSQIAERLLYADILIIAEIDDRLREDDRQICVAAEFHELLIESPHIANYVRKLEICLSSSRPIAPILPMLMQLDAILVTATYYGSWSSLSEEFRNAFMERLSSPLSVLKEVSIIYFDNFPLHILDGCKTVKHIGLHCQVKTQNNGLQALPHYALDSLSLRSWQPHSLDSEFMVWARKHIHSLQFLWFHSSNAESINKVLPELLRIYSTSLRSLEVNLSDGSYFNPKCVDLSSVPHLKDLTIRSNIHGTYCAFPAIIGMLETAPHLNNLTLKISFYDGPVVFNCMDWSPLLTFFSSSSHKFRHIELQLRHTISKAEHFIPSIDTIPALFDSEVISNLIAKGILDICSRKWTKY